MTFNPYPKDKQVNPAKRPTKPTAPPKPTKRRRYLTRHEHTQYTIATDRSRCADGYIRCEDCTIPLRDQDAQRHHIVYRSHGGPTIAENLRVCCEPCHRYRHEHGGRAASDYLTRPTLLGVYSTAVNA